MSSSIAIPKRRKKQTAKDHTESPVSSSSPSSTGTSYAGPSKSPVKETVLASPSRPVPTSPPSQEAAYLRDRRPSLLSASIAKTDYAVVNVGTAEAPRLITCVKSSQGFDWNLEMFLPPYVDYDFTDLEHKQDPVDEIILTEEELANMLPS